MDAQNEPGPSDQPTTSDLVETQTLSHEEAPESDQ